MQLGSSGNLDDGIAAAAEAGASENTGKRMVRVNSTLNRKVEFHKTKKLRKKASALYMHAMAEVGAGKFQVSALFRGPASSARVEKCIILLLNVVLTLCAGVVTCRARGTHHPHPSGGTAE